MRIAVIGSGGFIGSRLIERFQLGGGPEVVAIARRPSGLALAARFPIELRVADALDPRALAAALAGCDAVVHAALGDAAQIERMPAALCRAASAARVPRIVYLSSASVHGQNPAPGTDERSPLRAGHAFDYNNAKIAAEISFFKHCRRGGLAGYALRPGVVYGPRSRWIADLAADLEKGRACLLGEGQGVCNGIYVDNLIDAIRACLEAGSGAGEAYLVGDEETVTWADFYRAAADRLALPFASIHSVGMPPPPVRTWKDRLGRTVAHPVTQRLLPAIPGGVKRGVKALVASWSTPRVDSWALSAPPRPGLTAEMAALQSCRWKLPHRRAAEILAYRPGTPFAEGMRRSIAWWRFANGRLEAAP